LRQTPALCAGRDPRDSAPMSTPAPKPWVTNTLMAAWAALCIFGFVAAPHGCAWGTDAFGLAAVGVIALGVVLPWFRFDRPPLRRLRLAVACGFASLAVAIVVFFLADLPVFCP
jgi:hypothetical protein